MRCFSFTSSSYSSSGTSVQHPSGGAGWWAGGCVLKGGGGGRKAADGPVERAHTGSGLLLCAGAGRPCQRAVPSRLQDCRVCHAQTRPPTHARPGTPSMCPHDAHTTHIGALATTWQDAPAAAAHSHPPTHLHAPVAVLAHAVQQLPHVGQLHAHLAGLRRVVVVGSRVEGGAHEGRVEGRAGGVWCGVRVYVCFLGGGRQVSACRPCMACAALTMRAINRLQCTRCRERRGAGHGNNWMQPPPRTSFSFDCACAFSRLAANSSSRRLRTCRGRGEWEGVCRRVGRGRGGSGTHVAPVV